MIEVLAMQLNTQCSYWVPQPFRDEDAKAGLEPDECYYVQHAANILCKDRIDLSLDPPPRLACLNSGDSTVNCFRFLYLTSALGYEERSSGLAFLFLPVNQIQRFLDMAQQADDTTVIRAFQQWVRTLNHP
jgi:hypothetical protein